MVMKWTPCCLSCWPILAHVPGLWERPVFTHRQSCLENSLWENIFEIQVPNNDHILIDFLFCIMPSNKILRHLRCPKILCLYLSVKWCRILSINRMSLWPRKLETTMDKQNDVLDPVPSSPPRPPDSDLDMEYFNRIPNHPSSPQSPSRKRTRTVPQHRHAMKHIRTIVLCFGFHEAFFNGTYWHSFLMVPKWSYH